MNTITCPVCRGTGLIGAGEAPHLHLGTLSTCPNCGGTGVVEAPVEDLNSSVEEISVITQSETNEAPIVEAQTPSSSEEVIISPEVSESDKPVEDTSVDNVSVEPVVDGATLEEAQAQ